MGDPSLASFDIKASVAYSQTGARAVAPTNPKSADDLNITIAGSGLKVRVERDHVGGVESSTIEVEIGGEWYTVHADAQGRPSVARLADGRMVRFDWSFAGGCIVELDGVREGLSIETPQSQGD